MSHAPFLFGAGGIILGFIGGIAIGSATSGSRINEAVADALAPGQEAAQQAASTQQEALAALSERIGALEARLAESADSDDLAARLGERMEAMKAEMASRMEAMSDSAKTQADTLRSALSELSGGMQEAAQMAAAAVAAKAGASGGGEAAGGMTVTEPLAVGQTAIFAEGAVRAFVARLDGQGGAVRLVVNGTTAELGSGGTARVPQGEGSCSVSVLGLSDGKVTLGSDCGSAQEAEGDDAGAEGDAAGAEGDAAGAGAEAAGAAGGGEAGGETAAPENGTRPGAVAVLADGKLRVFVSGVASDGSSARIAVNGVQTQTVEPGASVEVKAGDAACTLTVTGIGGGMVGLEASCG
ncbi:apolipoprotein A1/A4/E family protein [Salipiger thiooxidans]|uniref:apolipoprotein A1/A4/E family protein n=1 Tax=Salipiger thiooxidans TaxID=282683 RepID=UPI001CD40C6A|nr:apolipoprotein A1/A4/E family protein [Salipiger thiooxidans]MCA0850984.1 apolipoprotein A1/A4/E family protein [Salipiger thiooxidans]